MPAELEVCVDALGERLQAQLGEAQRRRLRERLAPELGERLAAPQRQGAREERCPSCEVRLDPCALGQVLEAPEIGCHRAQGVAGGARLDRRRSERLAQRGHVRLQDLRRARRGRLAPEGSDQGVGRQHAPGVEQQAGEERAGLTARHLDRTLERSQHAELDHA